MPSSKKIARQIADRSIGEDERWISPLELTILHGSKSVKFDTRKEYDVARKIFGDFPLIGDTSQNWNLRLKLDLEKAPNHLFNEQEDGLRVFWGSAIRHFNFEFGFPYRDFWINQEIADKKLKATTGKSYKRERLAYLSKRTNHPFSTDGRELKTAIIPPNWIAVDEAFVDVGTSGKEMLFAAAVFNSYCLDYLVGAVFFHRQIALSFNRLPMPRLTAGHPTFDSIVPLVARLTCTHREYADLWREVMGEAWTESRIR